MDEGRDPDQQRRDTPLVFVPVRPGPVIDPRDQAEGRERDDLDDLVDELFPEVDGEPGLFDVGLLIVGAAMVGIGAPHFPRSLCW